MLSLLLLTVICFYLVMYTNWGTRVALKIVDSALSDLTIETVDGHFADKVSLGGVSYQTDSMTVIIDALELVNNHYSLWMLEFHFERIGVDGIDVNIQNSKDTSAIQKTPFEGIEIPIDVAVAELAISDLAIISQDVVQRIDSIKLDMTLLDDTVTIRELVLKSPMVQIQGDVWLDLDKRLEFSSQLDWQLNVESSLLAGQGMLKGSLDKIDINQHLHFERSSDALVAQSQLVASVQLKTQPYAIDAEFTNLQFEQTFEDKRLALQGGRLSLNGDLSDYRFTFDSPLEMSPFSGTASLSGQGNQNGILFENLRIASDTLLVQSKGEINWISGLKGFASMTLKDSELGQWSKQLSGRVSGGLQLEFQTLPVLKVSLESEDLNGFINDQALDANLAVYLDQEFLFIETFKAHLGENHLEAKGKFSNKTIDANLELNAPNLNSITTTLDGNLVSKLSLQGSLRDPQFQGQLQGSNLKYQDVQLSNLKLSAGGRLSDRFSLQGKAINLTVSENVLAEVDFTTEGNLSDHQARLVIDTADFTSELDVIGSYHQQTLTWAGLIQKHEIQDKFLDSRWNIKQPVKLTLGSTIKLPETCWENLRTNSNICLGIKGTQRCPELSLRLHELDIALLRKIMPQRFQLQGLLNGHATLNIAPNALQLESNLSLNSGLITMLDPSAQVKEISISKALLIANSDGNTSNAQLEVETLAGSKLLINTTLFDDLTVEGTLSGVMKNTDPLASLSEEIVQISGPLSASGNFSGPWNRPDINFTLDHSGDLQLKTLGPSLKNTQISIQGSGNSSYAIRATTHSAQSQLNSIGRLSLSYKPTLNWQYQGTLQAQEFQLFDTPELRLTVSPDLSVLATNQQMFLSGNLEITDGAFYLKTLPETVQLRSEDVIVEEAQVADDSFKILLDINTTIADRFYLEALGLTTELTGSLRLKKELLGDLEGFGSLALTNGSYSMYGQQLQIRRGELFFDGPVAHPQIDVVAVRRSNDQSVIAGVNIGGTPNYLQSSLFSEPGLSDIEILSYLTTGNSLQDDNSVSQTKLLQAALLLGLKETTPFMLELQSKLGIDVLSINDTPNSQDAGLEAGKQVNDQLYVGYNHGIFNRQGYWLLRYQLSKALRLESTYGNSQSIDLIYTIKRP